MKWQILFFYLVKILIFSHCDELPACLPKDFHYDFTECDEHGGRWRVSVPNPGVCIGGAPNAPKRVNDCTNSCEAGTYYNKSTLECLPCPPGTYSLGGGIKFDTWDRLPPGFHLNLESFEHNFRFFRPSSIPPESLNCTNYGWQPKGNYLASHGGMCSATLSYSVKLVKSGAVTYVYQYTDESIIFNFEAQNDRCQAIQEAKKYKWPSLTEEGEWKTMTVALSPGLNILYWKTIGMNFNDYGEQHKIKPVRIRSIEISGVAYTSECSPCAPGTYSSQGSKLCTLCPEGTYSQMGSSACLNCDPVTQYSLKGSRSCLDRPPCTRLDYYDVHSQCDGQHTTQLVHQWVKPKICREDLPNAAVLPPAGMRVPCPPCNPGQAYNNQSQCVFCPRDHYSTDGGCQRCPVSTVPNYGYLYKTWHGELPGITFRCMSMDGDQDGSAGCRDSPAWQPAGSYIHTILGHKANSFLILSLSVPGFRGRERIVNGHPAEIGRISFTFELDCVSECQFIFMMASARRSISEIQRWSGRQEKQFFTLPITMNDSYIFNWAFQRYLEDAPSSSNSTATFVSDPPVDIAKIYEISVTNTITGGAAECVPCPEGTESEGCIPCPPGHYIMDRETLQCLACPPNTYVSVPVPYGLDSCKACGPGLQSYDGQNCYTDCRVRFSPHESYDFTPLAKAMEVQGTALFTGTGNHYFHIFNITLCGDLQGRPQALCKNNVTYHSTDLNMEEVVRAMVCRSTVVPSTQMASSATIAIQAVSLGEILTGISREPELGGITVAQDFLNGEGSASDIHFFYSSGISTDACHYGRSTTITLRCSPAHDGAGEISLPSSCSDGTCDGCNFHFLWKTKYACRKCELADYQVVKGECVRGKQTIHYIQPKGCIAANDGPTPTTQPCSAIPREIQILIGVSVATGALLMALLFYFWKKNRKLEYKYMKLVKSRDGKEEELPAAESCAIDDEEEENYEDAVTFKDKSSGILGKFRTIRVSDKNHSGTKYETIHLTKSQTSMT